MTGIQAKNSGERTSMKKVIIVIHVLALFCVTLTLLTACATEQFGAATATANTALTTEAIKAASGEIVVGTIKALDPKANTIRIKDQTITVKPADMARLKVGNKVKVTLAAGTMNADKIVQLGQEDVKQSAKTKAKEVKDQAIQTAIDKAVEMQGQQVPAN